MQIESSSASIGSRTDRRAFVMMMSLVIVILTGAAVATTQLGGPLF